jgi:hypothetical protein
MLVRECFVVLPGLYGDPGLELSPAAVAEPGAHPEEGLLVAGRLPRTPQPEEGVVLHRALPQVLAALLRAQSDPQERQKFVITEQQAERYLYGDKKLYVYAPMVFKVFQKSLPFYLLF